MYDRANRPETMFERRLNVCVVRVCVYESVVFEPFRHCHSYCGGDEQRQHCVNETKINWNICITIVWKSILLAAIFWLLFNFALILIAVLFDTQTHHHLSFRTARKSNINGTTCVTYLIVHTLLSLIAGCVVCADWVELHFARKIMCKFSFKKFY